MKITQQDAKIKQGKGVSIMLEITLAQEPSINRIMISGELDMATVDKFIGFFSDFFQSDNPKSMEIDLAELRFSDSTGVRSLMTVINLARQKDREISIRNIDPLIYEILETTGILRLCGPELFHVQNT